MPKSIQVKVIPNAKKNEIKEDNIGLKVYLTAPPVDGKANKLLLKMLSEYLNVSSSQIRIAKGEKTRVKIIEI